MNRTIFLTPGLVELGAKTKQIHYQIAQKLIDTKIDLVILIETSSSRFILEYFQKIAQSKAEKVQNLSKNSQNNSNSQKLYQNKIKSHNPTSVTNLASFEQKKSDLGPNLEPKELTKKKQLTNQESDFQIPQIMTFKSAKIAHQNLVNILQKGDIILFQNDWTDNYS